MSLLSGASLAGSALPAQQASFNEVRLQDGIAAYQGGRYADAIDEFRVAAFGVLDQPKRLVQALVWLSLAQAGADKTADADQTLNRFLDVERRFGAYADAPLEPGTRTAFQALLTKRIPAASLKGVSSVSGVSQTEEQQIAKLPPAERRKALEAAARREPKAIGWRIALSREALEAGEARDAERWAEKAMELDPANADAIGLRIRARVARGAFADAARDLAALPAAELEKRPELYADKFVCLVESRDFAAADKVAGRVPPGLAGRSDVVRARQKLSASAMPR